MAVANGDVYVTDGEGVQVFDAAGSENCSGTPKVCTPLWATSTHISTGPAFTPGRRARRWSPRGALRPGIRGRYCRSASGRGVRGGVRRGRKNRLLGDASVCVPMWTTTGLPASPATRFAGDRANGVLYIANERRSFAFDATGSARLLRHAEGLRPAVDLHDVTETRSTVRRRPWRTGSSTSTTRFPGCSRSTRPGRPTARPPRRGRPARPCGPPPPPGSGARWRSRAVSSTDHLGAGMLSAFDATASKNCPATAAVPTCTRAPLWTSAPLRPGTCLFGAGCGERCRLRLLYRWRGRAYAFDAAGSLNCSVSGTAKACSPLWSGGVGTGLTAGVSPEIDGGSPVIVDGVPLPPAAERSTPSHCEARLLTRLLLASPRMPGPGLGML